MSSPEPEQITGVVLAGGQSRRMNGANKALLVYQGKRLFQYAVENLASCCHDVLINASRDIDTYREMGFTVIDDRQFSDCGPVAGIHSGLECASTPFVAFSACDQLALPARVYQTLSVHVTGDHGAYACSGADSVPTCCILPNSLASAALRALESNDLALMAFMRTHAKAVRFDDIEFANVNFRHQLESR